MRFTAGLGCFIVALDCAEKALGTTSAIVAPGFEWIWLLRKRRCARGWPPNPIQDRANKAFTLMEAHYASARLRPGMICPHRGVCLKSVPVGADGTFGCEIDPDMAGRARARLQSTLFARQEAAS